jgi:hypothetical protein
MREREKSVKMRRRSDVRKSLMWTAAYVDGVMCWQRAAAEKWGSFLYCT